VEQSLVRQLTLRVAQLESKGRRDRMLALCAVLLLASTAQVGSGVPPPNASGPVTVSDGSGASAILTATGLAIRDTNNRTRLRVWLDEKSRPSVDFSDGSGTLRQTLFLAEDNSPIIRQVDSKGKTRAEMYLASDTQNPQLNLLDANESKRVALFQGSAKLGEVNVFGSDGKQRAALVGDDNGPYMVMKDQNQTVRVAIGVYTSGKIGMDVRNSAGTTIWSSPTQ